MPRDSRQLRLMRFLLLIIVVGQIVLFCCEPAWAQGRRGRASGQTEIWMYVRWSLLTLLVIGTYFFCFHLLFNSLLRRGSWPKTSYGVAWAVFFLLTTALAVGLLGPDLFPQDYHSGTPRLLVYRIHLIMVSVGTVLTVFPLLYFRSNRHA